jgi:hypothetical protein
MARVARPTERGRTTWRQRLQLDWRVRPVARDHRSLARGAGAATTGRETPTPCLKFTPTSRRLRRWPNPATDQRDYLSPVPPVATLGDYRNFGCCVARFGPPAHREARRPLILERGRTRHHRTGPGTRGTSLLPAETLLVAGTCAGRRHQAASQASRLIHEARELNLPVEPGLRDGRNALVCWVVLLEGVIRWPSRAT